MVVLFAVAAHHASAGNIVASSVGVEPRANEFDGILIAASADTRMSADEPSDPARLDTPSALAYFFIPLPEAVSLPHGWICKFTTTDFGELGNAESERHDLFRLGPFERLTASLAVHQLREGERVLIRLIYRQDGASLFRDDRPLASGHRRIRFVKKRVDSPLDALARHGAGSVLRPGRRQHTIHRSCT